GCLAPESRGTRATRTQKLCSGIEKRLRCGESWPHSGVEQWSDRGPGASIETLKETNVWPRPLRSPTETSSQVCLEKALQADTPLLHQKIGRASIRGEVCSSVRSLYSTA